MEFVLHRLSLVIGYAIDFVAQIRLMLVFVSHQFCTVSQEFILSSDEDAWRHFAEQASGRHDGISFVHEEEECRCNGTSDTRFDAECRHNGALNDDWSDDIREDGHAYLNYI